MDALTDILETIHLCGSVYCRSELTGPWGLAIPAGRSAQFHIVRQGRCWLRCDGEPRTLPLWLEVGDVVLLPHGHAHVLADDPRTPAEPLAELLARHRHTQDSADSPTTLSVGGGGERTTLLCGYFNFDPGIVHPLLSVLPPVIRVGSDGGGARSWLESTLDLIAAESSARRPGGETLINRLTEAMFIHVLRAFLEDNTPGGPSWLVGLRDPQIASALGLIHRRPNERWTVQDLASRVGMSRSAFSIRFREQVGEPPLQYLTRWRMQVAAGRLRETRLPILAIAEAVGYSAEASFSKVFKRLWGIAPAAFRRGEAALAA